MVEDVRPFAPLIGRRLNSIEFVLNSYDQLRFDGSNLNAYNLPRVVVGDVEYRSDTSGYRDALCDRICATLDAGYATEDDIGLKFSDGTALLISLRPEDTEGEEPAELWTEEAGWVWQATVPGITRFVKPS